jgi:hypothetical protein
MVNIKFTDKSINKASDFMISGNCRALQLSKSFSFEKTYWFLFRAVTASVRTSFFVVEVLK